MINCTRDDGDKCLLMIFTSLNQTLCIAVRFLSCFAFETHLDLVVPVSILSAWPH